MIAQTSGKKSSLHLILLQGRVYVVFVSLDNDPVQNLTVFGR